MRANFKNVFASKKTIKNKFYSTETVTEAIAILLDPCLYFDSKDPLTYAGTRNVDGQMPTLLKSGNTIMVLPIDQTTARRLKRLAVGDAVTVTKGKINTKGRSR